MKPRRLQAPRPIDGISKSPFRNETFEYTTRTRSAKHVQLCFPRSPRPPAQPVGRQRLAQGVSPGTVSEKMRVPEGRHRLAILYPVRCRPRFCWCNCLLTTIHRDSSFRMTFVIFHESEMPDIPRRG